MSIQNMELSKVLNKLNIEILLIANIYIFIILYQ